MRYAKLEEILKRENFKNVRVVLDLGKKHTYIPRNHEGSVFWVLNEAVFYRRNVDMSKFLAEYLIDHDRTDIVYQCFRRWFQIYMYTPEKTVCARHVLEILLRRDRLDEMIDWCRDHPLQADADYSSLVHWVTVMGLKDLQSVFQRLIDREMEDMIYVYTTLKESVAHFISSCGTRKSIKYVFRFLKEHGRQEMIFEIHKGEVSVAHRVARNREASSVRYAFNYLVDNKRADLIFLQTYNSSSVALLASAFSSQESLKYVVDLLVEHGRHDLLSITDQRQRTIFHYIACREDTIDYDLLTSIFMHSQNTPNKQESNDIFNLLDQQDDSRCTAAHVAAIYGNKIMIEFLHGNGADLTIEDTRGNTPAQLAIEFKHQDIVDYLIRKDIHIPCKMSSQRDLSTSVSDPIELHSPEESLSELYISTGNTHEWDMAWGNKVRARAKEEFNKFAGNYHFYQILKHFSFFIFVLSPVLCYFCSWFQNIYRKFRPRIRPIVTFHLIREHRDDRVPTPPKRKAPLSDAEGTDQQQRRFLLTGHISSHITSPLLVEYRCAGCRK